MPRHALLAIYSLTFAALIAGAQPAKAAEPLIKSSIDAAKVSKKKQTRLGLYIMAKKAAAILTSQKDVILIDVRTPEETMFVGYPNSSAANIPFKFMDPDHNFNQKKGSYALVPNKNFVSDVRAFMETPTAKNAKILLLMCRSGSRSAAAVDALAKAGYSNVYSVIDGFEGDKDNNGKRTVNGWINSGAPWMTKIKQRFWHRNSG